MTVAVVTVALAGAEQPNILFIMVDDLGKEWISSYGAEDITTPHIDALATGGMKFNNAYSMPQCTPSRVTLLTGKYPWRTGWVNHWDAPRWGVGYFDWKPKENTTFARLMNDLGYATCAAGKWQINDFRIEPQAMKKHGFDDWCMWTGYETGNRPSAERYQNAYVNTPEGSKTYSGEFGPDVYADYLIDFMKQHKDEPMCLYFPMALTHGPLVPTPDEPDATSPLDKHKAMVRYTDKLVGRLVTAVDELGIRENTIVIFTTDNGSGGSITGTLDGVKVRGGKAKETESGVCEPFIVNCPGLVEAGTETDALTDFTDLLPTFVELAGGSVSDDLTVDGVSIAPIILGESTDSHREWIMALGHGPAVLDDDGVRGKQDFATRVIRDKRFKVWVSNERAIIRLHDLQEDPYEETNLVDSQRPQHQSALSKFKAVLESLPERDARPLYTARGANAWDRKPGDMQKPVPTAQTDGDWIINSTRQWRRATLESDNLEIVDGMATPTADASRFKSVLRTFDKKRSVESIVFDQSPVWQNWDPIENVGPTNMLDAPVLLSLGPDNYWLFGMYGDGTSRREQRDKSSTEIPDDFRSEPATLDSFDIPLRTTPLPNQYDAPGGLNKGLGGYHAWQSKDMINWVHHGPVTEAFSRWVTTAEYADGKTYLYYDYPNDQDPHLYIDDDLTDGVPGKNMGIAFKDPSHGSDCTFIRDKDGTFHVIYEDWSPINARQRSWDSPLAGHAVSADGIGNFEILQPVIDNRTTPTGEVAEYKHPHWAQHPDWDSSMGEYNVHAPEQEAYGDWAALSVGSQYYLFGDFDPVGGHDMSVGWFTSPSLDGPFTWCDNIGSGHPDPDIGFAEGQFYLVTQQPTDYTSPGPWVETVTARVGVDSTNDGVINHWSDWEEVKESYNHTEGYSKHIAKTAAAIALTDLPGGYAFQFEFKMVDATDNKSMPIMDKVSLYFED